ncbi:hypothetical protein [Nocardia nova]|uniref:hypothetical protein n=1 Tax=Nocardia nova TaxID=37330 RepID=UPI0011B04CDB|nr:hypothetical protein [Nocardia nova]
MMRTIDFGATGDGKRVLAALDNLADMISPQRTRGLPARRLDARQVDHDPVGGGRQRRVYPPECPEQTVDRAAYTLCPLEQFHRHLKRNFSRDWAVDIGEDRGEVAGQRISESKPRTAAASVTSLVTGPHRPRRR